MRKRRPRSACAYVQSDQGLYYPLTKSVDTTKCINVWIKHVFPCINIRQDPREVLKTEAGGRGFQHLPRDLVNVNALKKHVRSLLLQSENICYLSPYFLHYFVSPFHWCLANAISTDYARSGAGHYTSRDGSNSVGPVQAYWKLHSRDKDVIICRLKWKQHWVHGVLTADSLRPMEFLWKRCLVIDWKAPR